MVSVLNPKPFERPVLENPNRKNPGGMSHVFLRGDYALLLFVVLISVSAIVGLGPGGLGFWVP